ncbi:uncharacterized protein B0T15DRAFT_167839 [Chaetomium strumarium]|uniref:Uncharacterized protein n=1 Tax=Chaetomium strumarium TaxID=1170767 RepID=A0AAJ0GWC5_9PEZI|nr:hypothetical protein B0T15DRAFT_167839 [Chaetomium strumarium]
MLDSLSRSGLVSIHHRGTTRSSHRLSGDNHLIIWNSTILAPRLSPSSARQMPGFVPRPRRVHAVDGEDKLQEDGEFEGLELGMGFGLEMDLAPWPLTGFTGFTGFTGSGQPGMELEFHAAQAHVINGLPELVASAEVPSSGWACSNGGFSTVSPELGPGFCGEREGGIYGAGPTPFSADFSPYFDGSACNPAGTFDFGAPMSLAALSGVSRVSDE